MPWTPEDRAKYPRKKKKAERLELIRNSDVSGRSRVELAQLLKERKANAALFGTQTLEQSFQCAGVSTLDARETMVRVAGMLAASNEKLAKIVEIWDGLCTSKKKQTTLDQLCKMVDMQVWEFIGTAGAEAARIGIETARMLVGMAQPQLIQKAIEFGMTPEGFKDRQLVLQAGGIAPSPKGINIALSQTTQQVSGSTLPDFETDELEIIEAVRG